MTNEEAILHLQGVKATTNNGQMHRAIDMAIEDLEEDKYRLAKRYYDSGFSVGLERASKILLDSFAPVDIIFNGPATIVKWCDGTKTVVKCDENDEFDPYKGIALCFMKKIFHNKGSYNDVFKIFSEEIDEAIIEHGLIEHEKRLKAKKRFK